MAFEVRELSGSLFINNYKERDAHPDRTGECRIEGQIYRMAGWVKKDRNGKPWMSLAFTKKEEEKDKPLPTSKDKGYEDMDDDIPF